jgi:hypothetical protein
MRGWLALLFAFVATALGVAETRPASGNPRQEFLDKLAAAAIERTNHSVKYVSDYVHLDYPGGDVPADTGVCTDEIIRAYIQGRRRGFAKGSARRYGEELADVSAKIKVATKTSRSEYRSPARAESDGVFQPQGREPAYFLACGGLFAGRDGHLGFGRRRAAYRYAGACRIQRKRATPSRSQHRPGTKNGRCIVPLENYRTLPVLWTASARIPLILQPERMVAPPQVSCLDMTM